MKSSISPVCLSGPAATNIIRIPYVVSVLLGVLCVLGPARVGVCEKISYGKVSLAVDSIEPAGAGLLKIELDRETFLVSEKDASRKVLLRMINKGTWSQKLPFESFEVIIREALNRNDEEVLQAAVVAGLRDVAYEELDKELIWREMLASSIGREVLVRALRVSGAEGRPERVCQVLLLVRQAGDLETQEALYNLQAALSERCLSISIDNAVKTLVVEGDLTQAMRTLESARRIFAPASEANATKGAKVGRGLAVIGHAIENSNGDVLASAVAEMANNTRLEGVSFAKSARVEELFAATAIERGKFRQLLSYLPHFDLTRRTTRMHESVLAAIRGIAPAEYSVFGDEKIAAAIKGFADKDEEISQAYREALERVIAGLVDKGSLREAVSILETNRALLSPVSTTMRRSISQIVRGYGNRGEIADASRVLGQWLSPAPKLLKFDLVLAKYGLSVYRLLFVLLSFVIGAVWWRIKRVSGRVTPKESPKATTSSGAQGAQATPNETQTSSSDEEYVENLRFFGLTPKATLPEIKHAYRQAVKECHPDLNQDDSPESKSMFIAITRRYERLMALRAMDQVMMAEAEEVDFKGAV